MSTQYQTFLYNCFTNIYITKSKNRFIKSTYTKLMPAGLWGIVIVSSWKETNKNEPKNERSCNSIGRPNSHRKF